MTPNTHCWNQRNLACSFLILKSIETLENPTSVKPSDPSIGTKIQKEKKPQENLDQLGKEVSENREEDEEKGVDGECRFCLLMKGSSIIKVGMRMTGGKLKEYEVWFGEECGQNGLREDDQHHWTRDGW